MPPSSSPTVGSRHSLRILSRLLTINELGKSRRTLPETWLFGIFAGSKRARNGRIAGLGFDFGATGLDVRPEPAERPPLRVGETGQGSIVSNAGEGRADLPLPEPPSGPGPFASRARFDDPTKVCQIGMEPCESRRRKCSRLAWSGAGESLPRPEPASAAEQAAA